MPKKGEPLSDEHKEILAKAREKALAIRREKSKQKADIKLANEIEKREMHEKAQKVISKAVTKEDSEPEGDTTSIDEEHSREHKKKDDEIGKKSKKNINPRKKVVYVEESSSESSEEEEVVVRKKKGEKISKSKIDDSQTVELSERDKLYMLTKKSLLGFNYQ